MRDLYEGIVNNLDNIWLGTSAGFYNMFGDHVDRSTGALGQWTDINWKRRTVSLGDPTGVNTWRFRLDKFNQLILYKGISCSWHPDHHLTCWRDLEVKLKARIDNEVNQILLEE